VSILSDFEDRVAGAVEGMFAGVFRSPVQPAELARACGKEMDRRRKLGVGKVYAPTMYSVLLSPADGDALEGFADTLAGELETYLLSYARQKRYELTTRPHVRFLVDPALKLGRFEVIGELLSADEIAAEVGADEFEVEFDESGSARPPARPKRDEPASPESPPSAPPVRDVAVTTVFAAAGAAPSAPATVPVQQPARVVLPGGEHVVLAGDRQVIGRLKACDVCVQDKNASREHPALEREGSGWVVVDLGSTNGTYVNGERIERFRLRDHDVITIGVSELEYREAGARQ
jgi:hypothetical protein